MECLSSVWASIWYFWWFIPEIANLRISLNDLKMMMSEINIYIWLWHKKKRRLEFRIERDLDFRLEGLSTLLSYLIHSHCIVWIWLWYRSDSEIEWVSGWWCGWHLFSFSPNLFLSKLNHLHYIFGISHSI